MASIKIAGFAFVINTFQKGVLLSLLFMTTCAPSMLALSPLDPKTQNYLAVNIVAISLSKGLVITDEHLNDLLSGVEGRVLGKVVQVTLKDGRRILSSEGSEGLERIKEIVTPDIVLTEEVEGHKITHVGMLKNKFMFIPFFDFSFWEWAGIGFVVWAAVVLAIWWFVIRRVNPPELQEYEDEEQKKDLDEWRKK